MSKITKTPVENIRELCLTISTLPGTPEQKKDSFNGAKTFISNSES